VARLKNSADFLENVVEAFLPYLDEIILVAEQATDGTNEICERLAQAYPEKVKYYFYPFTIRFRDYDGEDQPTSDSIYSFAYFTNWAFSRTTYKYVMRLDDDILPIPETWEKMRTYILKNTPNEYILYYGVNLHKIENQIGIMQKYPRVGTW
jgi:glycosyltransferase involved in cell wall biosynthesis